MPKFNYSAKNNSGQDVTGVVEADTKKIAVSLLKDRGYLVYSINEKKSGFNLSISRISDNDKVNFTQNLATMINSGLPIAQALTILVQQTKSKKLQEVINNILKDVESGSSLSVAFSKYPEVFSSSYVSLVEAGEASGKLDEVLKRLADTLNKQRQFKNKVKSAMLYPAIVSIVMVIVVFIIMIFVVPKLTTLYDGFDTELPLPTRIMISMSDFARRFWYILLALGVGGYIGLRQYSKTPGGAAVVGRFTFRLPIFGPILKERDLTEFTRSLALLNASGVSIVDSLVITIDAVTSPIYKASISGFVDYVKKGGALSEVVREDVNFPAIISEMLKVGEETGDTAEVLLKVSGYFEEEVDRKIEGLTTAIEPIIIAVLGLVVGGLILAVITPIYELTNQF
jgi:type IV pilus assembly protein PilC